MSLAPRAAAEPCLTVRFNNWLRSRLRYGLPPSVQRISSRFWLRGGCLLRRLLRCGRLLLWPQERDRLLVCQPVPAAVPVGFLQVGAEVVDGLPLVWREAFDLLACLLGSLLRL